jgi:hypothetical protein
MLEILQKTTSDKIITFDCRVTESPSISACHASKALISKIVKLEYLFSISSGLVMVCQTLSKFRSTDIKQASNIF